MDIPPPPCVAKEEGDILDCYFFTRGNVHLIIYDNHDDYAKGVNYDKKHDDDNAENIFTC